jgi:4,4'-diaponeurosporenoate glycosyltransferase
MYPHGVRPLLQGWTKNIATGAGSVPWWAAPLMVGWIWSLAGGPFASWWCYLASVVQVAVQGRRVGRFGPIGALVYPLLLAVFLVVFVRSAVLTALGREVWWRGRRVPSRRRR